MPNQRQREPKREPEREPERDQFGHALFPAGQKAPSGRYKQIDGPHVIELVDEGVLPAVLDGRSTYYTRLQTWDDIQRPEK